MLRGVALKIASTVAFAAMGALVKVLGETHAVAQIVFFRSLLALATVAVWLRLIGDFPRALHTGDLLGHGLRGLAGVGGMSGFFVGLALLPLPDATALTYATPLLVVILAAVLLREKVRLYRWAAVVVGLAGVLLMVSDHLDFGAGVDLKGRSGWGVAASLFGAACASLAAIQTRRLTLTEKTGAIVFYFSALTTLAGLLAMAAAALWPAGAPGGAFIRGQAWIDPDARALALLCALGLAGGIGQILLTESYRYADASVISPLEYVSMIWAASLGYALFGEAPSRRIALGAVVVAGAGVYLIWRERRNERRAPT